MDRTVEFINTPTSDFALFNDGQKVKATDYFASAQAHAGVYLMSFNAGAARLLVPSRHEASIAEMRTGKTIVMTRGSHMGVDSIEILFDDDSDTPFVVTLGANQIIPLPDETFTRQPFPLLVYSSIGLEWEHEAHYRIGTALPDLRPL